MNRLYELHQQNKCRHVHKWISIKLNSQRKALKSDAPNYVLKNLPTALLLKEFFHIAQSLETDRKQSIQWL